MRFYIPALCVFMVLCFIKNCLFFWQRPLVLAKILGVFSIGYRNTRTGNSKRLDVIVMENLLYGRKSSKVQLMQEQWSGWHF